MQMKFRPVFFLISRFCNHDLAKIAREAKKKRRKKKVSEEEKTFFPPFNGPLIMVYSEMNYESLFDFPPCFLPLWQLFRALLPGLSDFEFCSIFFAFPMHF